MSAINNLHIGCINYNFGHTNGTAIASFSLITKVTPNKHIEARANNNVNTFNPVHQSTHSRYTNCIDWGTLDKSDRIVDLQKWDLKEVLFETLGWRKCTQRSLCTSYTCIHLVPIQNSSSNIKPYIFTMCVKKTHI